jgi:hypothetical protein
MLAVLKAWIERRRRSHHRCQEDACRLMQQDEAAAYYEAQRLTARARAAGDAAAFVHWARVAAEVAGISPRAQMDPAVLNGIVDAELRCSTKTAHPTR